MKIVSQNGHGAPKETIILPLTGTSSDELTKDNSKTFEISTAPGIRNATTYKMSVRVYNGNEDLRTKIQWVKDVNTS